MGWEFGNLDGSHLVVEREIAPPGELAIVERKGWGHPDTLADHLAERLSRAYARHTLQRFGAVLHHNFDKLGLLGGASEVRYGAGRMVDSVRVLVNGRATRSCGGETIPVDELIQQEVVTFVRERLPELDGHVAIELNIASNSSPGAVLTGDCPGERQRWFAPASADDLRERKQLFANDTSLGTGWAPQNRDERFVQTLTDHLSGPTRLPDGAPVVRNRCEGDGARDQRRVGRGAGGPTEVLVRAQPR